MPRIALIRRLSLALLFLIAGCASHTRISAGGGGPAGVRVGIDVRSTSAVGAVIAIGALGAIYGSGSEPDPPRLLEGRKVNEQDCTKPIADPSANLRCR
jgi:hypothetical protein